MRVIEGWRSMNSSMMASQMDATAGPTGSMAPSLRRLTSASWQGWGLRDKDSRAFQVACTVELACRDAACSTESIGGFPKGLAQLEEWYVRIADGLY